MSRSANSCAEEALDELCCGRRIQRRQGGRRDLAASGITEESLSATDRGVPEEQG
ncbi:hypothetical protein P4233_01705 [Pseudomonas aeruginosa]|nr:hypothetical protein [Pseudomonas aeruginosa]